MKVRLLIRAGGTVASVEVLVSSGDAALDEAARQGLLRWRFAPATRDGTPIDAYLIFWVVFGD
ncbi:MAG: TonB family protein [Armatimonadetes bacterium]|nr:TonB family protein [Armatimonadota bacterium]